MQGIEFCWFVSRIGSSRPPTSLRRAAAAPRNVPRSGAFSAASLPEMDSETTSQTNATRPQKLHKVLARAGIASRRACEALVLQGRVRVNGLRARVEDRVNPSVDRITVDRRPLPRTPPPIYVMLHKPRGYVTTVNDPQGRRTVNMLVSLKERLYPVGRLDLDSTGLLLLTNDGEFALRLTHPRYHVPRVYMVTVRGNVPDAVLNRLRRGIMLDDGMTSHTEVETVDRASNLTLLRMTVHEGRKRQIRRMCKAVSHPVVTLHRTAIGPLRLGDLAPGQWRYLLANEIKAIRASTCSHDHQSPGTQQRRKGSFPRRRTSEPSDY